MANSIHSPSRGSRQDRVRQTRQVAPAQDTSAEFSRLSRDRRLREQMMERRFVWAFLVVLGLTVGYLMARSPLSHLWP